MVLVLCGGNVSLSKLHLPNPIVLAQIVPVDASGKLKDHLSNVQLYHLPKGRLKRLDDV